MRELNEAFSVEDGFLVRRVVPERGKPYEHRCPLAAFAAVALAVGEADQPLGLESLAAATNLPVTQVNTAFAFLKERGLVELVHGRKHKRATADVHLDALIEYHALAWKQEHPGEAT